MKIKEQIEQNFVGLTSAFNTSFQMEDKDIRNLITETEKNIELIEENKNKLSNLIDDKKELIIEDQLFIKNELKSLIESTRVMLTKLESEIKIGSKSGYYDSYARLAMTVANQLKELRELNVSIVNLEIEKKKSNNDINRNRTTIVLDANALIELVEEAKKRSQINAIDANFIVEEKEE